MKKRFAGILCGILAAVMILSLFPVFAKEAESAPEVSSYAAAVYNLEADEVLYSKNFDARLDPAAFTKLMTALLAFDYYGQNGNVNVTVTPDMLTVRSGNQMKLKEGEVLSFHSLLSGLVVQNANDAANALAVTVGGSISGFAEKMNQRAKLLGMKNTYFDNATGQDSEAHTTIEDMILLCKTLYRVNDFMILSETAKVKIPATELSKERNYTNKNPLVPRPYATDYQLKNSRGMVAGYTSRAGYCIATVREAGGNKNLVIISGGNDLSREKDGSQVTAYREAKALMEWAEKNYTLKQIISHGQVICERKLRLASGVDHMILVAEKNLDLLLPVGTDVEKEVTTKVRTEKDVYTAPIIEGYVYGELDVYYRGELVETIPLVAKSNIGLSRGLVAWDAVQRFFSQGPAKFILILVIVGVILYIVALILAVIVQYFRNNRERNKIKKEMLTMENRRLKKLRQEELKETQAHMRKFRTAWREGYRVLQGDADGKAVSGKRGKTAPAPKVVARVPEKYRAANRKPSTPATPAPAQSTARRGETYRTGRPSRSATQNRSARSNTRSGRGGTKK